MADKQTSLAPMRTAHDPFTLLRQMTSELDRAFDDWSSFRWPVFRTRPFEGSSFSPRIEMFEKDNRLVTRVDLPGMKKEDVTVEVADDQLTLSGERKREVEDKKDNFYRSEREYGTFYRTVPLPEGVKPEDVRASFADGVLEVSVPMPAPHAAKATKVRIDDGKSTKSVA